jgi:hypothetical protein
MPKRGAKMKECALCGRKHFGPKATPCKLCEKATER